MNAVRLIRRIPADGVVAGRFLAPEERCHLPSREIGNRE